MGPRHRSLLALGADRRGGILPLAAVTMSIVIASLAFSTDYGALFAARRRVQAATDLAAIVAAQDPTDAARLARLSLADNGLTAPDALTVEPGRYSGDAALPPAARFRPGGTPLNAVRLGVRTRSPLYFGRFVTGRDTLPVAASALAVRAEHASVSIGSRLASYNAGLVNAILGGLLGTQVSLTALDYGALASAKLDLFDVTGALASRLDLRAATFSQILAGSVSIGQVFGATADSAGRTGVGSAALSALRSIATAVGGSPAPVALSRLFDPGDLGSGLAVGGDSNGIVAVSLLDFILSAAEIANGSHQVQVALSPAIPGVVRSQLTLAIGDRPQAGSWTVVGSVGDTVRTAQTRALLETWITAPLGLGTIYLPIFVESASAQATIKAIACPWSPPDQVGATIGVTPSPFDAAIATIPPYLVTASGPKPDLTQPATLVSTLLVGASGTARASLASPPPQTIVFSADDIAQHRVRTVGSTGLGGALATTLLGSLTLDVNVLGLGIGLPASAIRSSLLATISAATPGLDTLLDSVLRTLGVGVGQADVWMNAVRCDRAVLVQ